MRGVARRLDHEASRFHVAGQDATGLQLLKDAADAVFKNREDVHGCVNKRFGTWTQWRAGCIPGFWNPAALWFFDLKSARNASLRFRAAKTKQFG